METTEHLSLADAWLKMPAGIVPLSREEMSLLRRRIVDDPAARQSWETTRSLAAEFLAKSPGPLTPTPLAGYVPEDPQVTLNNNRADRFWAGWRACAWLAAIADDRAALQRCAQCLEISTRIHRETGGIQLIPGPTSPPETFCYHSTCSFMPGALAVHIELMRAAGFNDRALLVAAIERLEYLARLAEAGAHHIHGVLAGPGLPGVWNYTLSVGGALLTAAVMLASHPDAHRWEQLGWQMVADYYSTRTILPDGTYYEAFPGGEKYGLTFLVPALALHRAFRALDLSTLQFNPAQSLRNRINWHLKIASPLGELPCVNDTSAYDGCMDMINHVADHLLVLGQWAGLPQVWTAFRADRFRLPLWTHGVRPDHPPPHQSQSVLLSDVGWTFLRAGAGDDSIQLMFDHGLHSTSPHANPHCLTFDLTAFGRHVIVNSGCAPHYCTYPEQVTWHRRTHSGNCIEIDNADIPEQTDGQLLEWSQRDQSILVRAQHRGYPGITHERSILFHPHGTLRVTDRLLPTDRASHAAKIFWHINGSPIRRAPGEWIFRIDPRLQLRINSDRLTESLTLRHGPTGGLGGLNARLDKLPSLDPIHPGDPGWQSVPYLTIPLAVPPEGIALHWTFALLRDPD